MKNILNRFKAPEGFNLKSRTMWMKIVALLLAVFLIICLASTIRSCCNETYDFDTNEKAIACYRSFLKEVRETKTSDGQHLCDQINKWHEINDTVYHFLSRNKPLNAKSNEYRAFYDINDSIRYELLRITETWKCSFSDVVLIKEGTTPFRNDQDIIDAVHDATPFFLHLDSVPLQRTSKEESIQNYRAFLSIAEQKGIHSKADMLTFIKQEDIVFRAFLAHLYELDDDHVSDITHTTERICNQIFAEAKAKNIDARDALTYMSMRTVRRLLQNSMVCVNDITHRRMKSKIQANAYLWMIIQPFTNIDKFAITTLTPEGRKSLQYIAETLPKSSAFAKSFDIDKESLSYLLPQQLLKMYILTL